MCKLESIVILQSGWWKSLLLNVDLVAYRFLARLEARAAGVLERRSRSVGAVVLIWGET